MAATRSFTGVTTASLISPAMKKTKVIDIKIANPSPTDNLATGDSDVPPMAVPRPTPYTLVTVMQATSRVLRRGEGRWGSNVDGKCSAMARRTGRLINSKPR